MASKFLSRESSNHTFQPTDLVNESCLKLVDQTKVSWQGKTHFMAVSAQAIRRILVDHARTKHRKKRGGKDRIRLQLREDHAFSMECPEEILFVDEVLEKLVKLDPSTPGSGIPPLRRTEHERSGGPGCAPAPSNATGRWCAPGFSARSIPSSRRRSPRSRRPARSLRVTNDRRWLCTPRGPWV
jgi:hypothetical protein